MIFDIFIIEGGLGGLERWEGWKGWREGDFQPSIIPSLQYCIHSVKRFLATKAEKH